MKALLLIPLLILVSCSQNNQTSYPVDKDVPVTVQQETWDKERYSNPDYHFSLSIPAWSSVTDSRKEELWEYIRIQNYQSQDDSNFWLSPWEYYLEIWIEPKETAFQKSCKEIITESEVLQLWTQVWYYSFGQEWGDAGGIRRYICVENEKFIYNFNATENSADTPIANTILESITFTK